MSADQGAATGQMPYEPVLCVCGDLSTFHAINTKGERAGCSSSLCSCRRFAAAEAGAA